MDASTSRHIPIPGTFNVRDLGGYPTIDGNETLWRRFIRSDSLHRLDEAGVALLIDRGVTAVVDLRHTDELVAAPNPFSGRKGVQYINVNLLADLLPSGDAAHDPSKDVLLDLYLRALDQRGIAIREVLEAITEIPGGAVLFHCAAGKDRTGILAALLLSIAGVGREHVLDDYEMTATYIKPAIPDFERRALARGQDLASLHAMLASRRETMQATLSYLDERYGGVPTYLASTGLSTSAIERLRDRLLRNEAMKG
ncbi:tyrosine-protein phosphatase [Rhizobium binxianense]